MKQLFKTRNKRIMVDNVPCPICADNEILIEVYNSLISTGTETMGLKKQDKKNGSSLSELTSLAQKGLNRLKEEGISEVMRKVKNLNNISVASGYSVSGIVLDKGRNVRGFEFGDKVAAAGSGYASHAEVVSVPKNLVVKLPDKVDFRRGAFTTLGSIALQGVRQAGAQVGENVVVIGLGLVGLLTAQILKTSGCHVIAIDLNKKRVDLGKKLGVDLALVQGEKDVIREVLNFTDHIGADAILLCAATPSNEPVNQAMEMARKKGRIVIVGAVGMNLKRSPFYKKELEFTISCSYGPGRYDPFYEEKGHDYPVGYVRWTEKRNMGAFLRMVADGKIDVRSLITDDFDINDAPKAFEKVISDPGNTLGVIIHYPYKETDKKLERSVNVRESNPKPVRKERINIAVIGAGGFAKKIHLPIIAGIKDCNLTAVVTKTGGNAKRIAKEFKAEYCSTDYQKVLNDKHIDAVIIATRHNLHFPMAYEAVQAGKHVLLEKPMGINETEIDSLVEIVKQNKVVFTVGYNRRYSPLSVKVKDLIKHEKGPLVINYRVNAGYIPAEHWIQDSEIGGGRIIGECCHFYDLINYFMESEVEELTSGYIPINQKTVGALDNVISTITYQDGSLAVLTYTSLGNNKLPKEYIEIFINGKSIIIDDFRYLRLYGFKESDIKLKKQDKGHHGQIVEFVKKIKGEISTLLDVYDGATVAKMAIMTTNISGEKNIS